MFKYVQRCEKLSRQRKQGVDMAEFRRLISYIYEYEGQEKGKNVGFVKLETRNGMCRLNVNVKNLYIGSSDMGVYLMSGRKEIFLGNMFLRNGCGEFRAMVQAANVQESGETMDECYGLTIHGKGESWRVYTTIWEDAVAQAAQLTLEPVTSEAVLEREMERGDLSAVAPQKGKEEEGAAEERIREGNGSGGETLGRGMPEREALGKEALGRGMPGREALGRGMLEREVLGRGMLGREVLGRGMPERKVLGGGKPERETLGRGMPEREASGREVPEKEALEREVSEREVSEKEVSPEPASVSGGWRTWPGMNARSAMNVRSAMDARPGMNVRPPAMNARPRGEISPMTEAKKPEEKTGLMADGHLEAENPKERMEESPKLGMEESPKERMGESPKQRIGESPKQGIEESPAAAGRLKEEAAPAAEGMPLPKEELTAKERNAAMDTGIPNFEMGRLEMETEYPDTALGELERLGKALRDQDEEVQKDPGIGATGQSFSPVFSETGQRAAPVIRQYKEAPLIVGDPEALARLDAEDAQENRIPVWDFFAKTYPRIQAFDSEYGCQVLVIKPQDIGLLPREVWVYGNNSFLLHGYYNYRYLILARLENPKGAPRYLLGIPGHYYSNEKYMASMFGFPNFVLSKKQPSQDGRFGYWYTDVRMDDGVVSKVAAQKLKVGS